VTEWHEAGVWQHLHERLLAELRAAGLLDLSAALVDFTHLRALKRGGPYRSQHRPGHHPPRRRARLRPGQSPLAPSNAPSPGSKAADDYVSTPNDKPTLTKPSSAGQLNHLPEQTHSDLIIN
jgi:hypothetical protein